MERLSRKKDEMFKKKGLSEKAAIRNKKQKE